MFHRIRSHHDFMWSYTRALLVALRRPIFVFLTFIAATVCLLMTALFFFAERGVNPLVQQPFDAFYFVVTTMTSVGYGDIVPATISGKFISMLTMVLGTGIYVTFTAVLATVLIQLEGGKGGRD